MNRDDVNALIKKYKIEVQFGKIISRYNFTDEEKAEVMASIEDIQQYFKDEKEQRIRRENELFEKARHREDGLFLAIANDFWSDPEIVVVRKITDAEKNQYADWCRDRILVGVGTRKELKHIRVGELPKRSTDGIFPSSNSSVWFITPEEYDNYMRINQEREDEIKVAELKEYEAIQERRRKAEEEKQLLVSQVDRWEIKERTITDEGGTTKIYTHYFSINGEELSFIERNIFDVGVVINPNYKLAENLDKGGLAFYENGVMMWQTFEGDQGLVDVRPLTENEQICLDIVARYGKFAGACVRT